MGLIDELTARGAFVAARPIAKTIHYTTAKGAFDATVYVREMSVADRDALIQRMDGKDATSQTALLISMCVTQDEDGKTPFPYQDAARLSMSSANVAEEITRAINEVNFPKKAAA